MKHGDEEVEVKDIVETLMTDTTKADKDRLPNTGCDPNWEHGLSSIFIEVQTDQVRKKKSYKLHSFSNQLLEKIVSFWPTINICVYKLH